MLRRGEIEQCSEFKQVFFNDNFSFNSYVTYNVNLDLLSRSKVTSAAGFVLTLSSLHLVSFTTLGEDQIHTISGLEHESTAQSWHRKSSAMDRRREILLERPRDLLQLRRHWWV